VFIYGVNEHKKDNLNNLAIFENLYFWVQKLELHDGAPELNLVFFEKKFEFFERFCFSKNGSEKFEKFEKQLLNF
jgi:hypothetical protein